MRELKFRAWDIDNKQFVYAHIGRDDVWIDDGIGTIEMPFNHSDFEQCTGLKDKNGKEIYEGDIIDFFGEKYPVIYRAGCFWAEYSKTQKDHLFLYATDSEVIGNIHENPELVKEEK